MRAILGAMWGAIGDLLGKPLRGFLLISALGAAALLAGLTAAVIVFLVPAIAALHPAIGGWRPAWLAGGAEIAAGAGAIIVAVALWPLVALMIGGMLFESAAERIETMRFPADPPGRKIPFAEALGNTARLAPPAIALSLATLPLLLIPGVNVIAFLLVNALLMSREYFSLAALRFRPWAEVRALRARHRGAIFIAGLACAALMAAPVLNFLAPLYGAALMVRLNKALNAS
jgi:CysZ protein